MPRPLIADKPYPSLSKLKCDPLSVRIISPAYATSTGELNATLQYVYHSLNFSAKGDGARAELLLGIAVAEMMHVKLLGEALINMGASPVYAAQPPSPFNFYSAKFVSYSRSLRNMIEDDLMGERHAVCGYEKMLCRLTDPTLIELIGRIIEDEKLHISALKQSLNGLSC